LNSSPATLHIFVDHSVIEVFVNNGTSNIITRVYPTLDGQEITLFVEGEGTVQLDVQAWNINSIWSN
jgi:sucrose-6-phosphate hydrolase SacC (GH32 family)